MSEFEKELLNKVSPHDRTHNGNELFIGGVLLEHFKDWQPPKELVEVPQIVADWFENNEDDLSFKIWGYLINWKLQDKKSDFFKWMKKESECIETLIRMQDGYTVKKERLFILKHIDLNELYVFTSVYLAHGRYTDIRHEEYPKDVDMSKIEQCHFTQSEIDELNIGSYEQIAVKVGEV